MVFYIVQLKPQAVVGQKTSRPSKICSGAGARPTVTCFCSAGEKIDWIEAVDPSLTGAVEVWMGEVEGVIRRTLHKLAAQALAAYAATERSKWILEWPGQLVLNCSQVEPLTVALTTLLWVYRSCQH